MERPNRAGLHRRRPGHSHARDAAVTLLVRLTFLAGVVAAGVMRRRVGLGSVPAVTALVAGMAGGVIETGRVIVWRLGGLGVGRVGVRMVHAPLHPERIGYAQNEEERGP